MYKVRISEQVEHFLQTMAPGPKHKLREAIARLGKQQGVVRALENDLAGFWRLRVGRYRVIFCYVEPMTIDCVFAEERKLVYELFSALMREQLGRE
ncbi:hypothetical protein Ga0100231_002975 [Opitutaceae bacterium TAV4]|uniref:type II toxin-antitoxin system RelE family toxin n=1 Tax=Geminisphaera colitermitum TaxID=1148786 RepID=UPI000158C89D|nr:hypothetical protein [Geminisphaera colitermitum]RRJ97506.1 hypothetical protein Ga0100231_002975 [Opitutaceae bacterium TAV4]RRK01883.1 hypothetical protein Ga0100230_001095 [Opitutaceae bacterium TAV3]